MCNVDESTDHYLFDCNRFDIQRNKLIQQLSTRGITFSRNNKYILLGAKIENIENARFIKEHLFTFIEAINRVNESFRR